MITPNDFKDAVKFVLEREGGYVNDPADPGGETNMGISKRRYPDEDIKNMTRERAEEIYHRDYWLKFGCDKLPWPMSLLVFDTAVNMSPSVVAGLRESAKFDLFDFIMRRLYQYATIARKNPKLQKFLPGWIYRMWHLYRYMKATTERKAMEVESSGNRQLIS